MLFVVTGSNDDLHQRRDPGHVAGLRIDKLFGEEQCVVIGLIIDVFKSMSLVARVISEEMFHYVQMNYYVINYLLNDFYAHSIDVGKVKTSDPCDVQKKH